MRPRRAVPLVLGILVIGAMAAAFAASMGPLPATQKGYLARATDANDLKPAACTWTLNATPVAGSGTIGGTGGNDLILGSSGADTIDGGGGRDCILAGGGNDTITGNTTAHGVNVTNAGDYCDGGSGTDTVTTVKAGPNRVATCDNAVNVP